MQRHEAVKESLAFGRPDPRVQEIITMVVVLNPNYEESKELEQQLIEHVNSQVTDYKRIRGGVIFRKTIPRNSVGKLVRKKMRDWARDQVNNNNKK